MDEKKRQVAYAGMLSNVQIALDSGKFPNSPRTREDQVLECVDTKSQEFYPG